MAWSLSIGDWHQAEMSASHSGYCRSCARMQVQGKVLPLQLETVAEALLFLLCEDLPDIFGRYLFVISVAVCPLTRSSRQEEVGSPSQIAHGAVRVPSPRPSACSCPAAWPRRRRSPLLPPASAGAGSSLHPSHSLPLLRSDCKRQKTMFRGLEQQPFCEQNTDELRQRLDATHKAWIATGVHGIGTEQKQGFWQEYQALSDRLWERTCGG